MLEPEPSPSRGRGRPPTLDRTAVLDAAWKVVAERGLDRTRYSDVARASGAPVSTLQNAFGSLEALLNAAIDQAAGRDAEYLDTLPSESEATALERMERLVVGSFEEPDAFESWLVWLELWRAAARDTALAANLDKAYATWWSTAEEIIRHGQRSGEFTPDGDPRDLAIATVAMLDGCACALLLRAGNPDPAGAGRIAFQTIARALAAERGVSAHP
ncbi:MAG: TetR/AcrR family transcriptional regulator [Solirubrobacteraceae bacterium]|nr:TetR/AcrR family transcriptional regulator [Solirubrobacteraceae bacterium]